MKHKAQGPPKGDVAEAREGAGSDAARSTEECALERRGEVQVTHERVAPKSLKKAIHPRRWPPPVPEGPPRPVTTRKKGENP